MSDYKILEKNHLGFFQIDPLPTPEQLNEYYNSNYYDYGTYATKYSQNELLQKELSAFELQYLFPKLSGKALDIGCGEGFIMNRLASNGWETVGLDFSLDGISRHFAHLAKNVIKGDIYKSLNDLIDQETKFDLIICNNVLEHVIDPLNFLLKFKALCKETTIIRIQVPNDFSWLQNALKRDGMISNEYWVAPPAHLSYFNDVSIEKVLSGTGYKIIEVLGDFPIELFLMNEKSNYNLNRDAGPAAHKARLYFEVNLFKTSIDKYIAFRRGCGAAGVCRNMITYCKIR